MAVFEHDIKQRDNGHVHRHQALKIELHPSVDIFQSINHAGKIQHEEQHEQETVKHRRNSLHRAALILKRGLFPRAEFPR